MSDKNESRYDSVCFISLSAYGYFQPERATASGGAERQLSMLAKQLAELTEVQFIVGDYNQPRTEQIEGVTLQRAYSPEDPFLLQAWKLLSAMRRANADVYIFRGHAQKAAYTYALTRILRKDWIYNIASDFNIIQQPAELPKVLRYIFEHGVRDAATIITQTEYQRNKLQGEYNRDSVVVPNGYPLAKDTLGYNQRKYILWVGRFDEDSKQPHLFIELAEEFPERQFILIAPRKGTTYAENIIEKVDETTNITYTGAVHPQKIHKYYQEALALINTSRYEGFPNTFLEAWRVGTPVCSLTVNPNRFVDINIHLPHANGDISKLIRDIQMLINDNEEWELQSSQPREYVERNLSIEQVSKRYANAIGLSFTGNIIGFRSSETASE